MSYGKRFKKYLDDLAKPYPPGGGSCLSLIFCLGVSLLEMAINFTLRKKPSSSLRKYLQEIQEAKKKIYPFIDLDGEVFLKFLQEKDKRKKEEFLYEASRICLAIEENCYKIVSKSPRIEKEINKAIKSDFSVGIACLNLAREGAILNLGENNKILKKKIFTKRIEDYEKAKKII